MANDITHIERYICLDVDRTVLKSTTFVEDYVYPALERLYTEAGGDEAQVTQTIHAVKQEERLNRGLAFDYLAVYAEYARQQGWQPWGHEQVARAILDDVCKDVGRIPQLFIDDILVDGSIELIKTLQASGPWGFLTTGGRETQKTKLLVINEILRQELAIAAPGMVISSEQKAEMISTVWRSAESEAFLIPTDLTRDEVLYARTVVMIDDKPKNLKHSGGRIDTYLVWAAEAPVLDDEGRGPRRTLHEVRDLISA